MAKFDMTQLEKAETVPAGSLHLIEMGDGSGTKAVTQETLIKETGKALKVGDLAQLQTENKEKLVDAINEAAQSGGGGAAVDILDTPEEIEANTETGKAAGAAAVKAMFGALNDNLKGTGIDTRVNPSAPTQAQWRPKGSDGDWVNFSSAVGAINCGNLSPSSPTAQINISSKVPNYAKLTADNFLITMLSATASSYSNREENLSVSGAISKSYNPATGVLTVNGAYAYNSPGANRSVTMKSSVKVICFPNGLEIK